MLEYNALAEDWRAEQRVEDHRFALAPYVVAKFAGNKQARFEDFLALGPPGAQAKEDQPAGRQSADGMAAAFRRFAAVHNAEVERRERNKAKRARRT